MHACIVAPGSIFIGFMVGQGTLQHEKTCKFIVLSFKIKVRLNGIRNSTRRLPGSIFIDSGSAFGGLEVILDDLVASLLEVGFSMDFGEDLGLRQ